MHLPRLRLRTLVIFVALAGVAMGGVQYRRRSAGYRELATNERELENLERASERAVRRYAREAQSQLERHQSAGGKRASTGLAQIHDPLADQLESDIERALDEARSYADEADSHERRRAAFLRCARYPWLTPPGDKRDPTGR